MRYTKLQKHVLQELGLCNVIYRKMYKSEGGIGYTSRGTNGYDINIASDPPHNSKVNKTTVKSIVLVHEVGHVYYGHMNIDYKKELEDIKNVFESHNRKFSDISRFGGPNSFLNICMDLEVNNKLLTLSNIEDMKNVGWETVTSEAEGIDVYDDFRDYYDPIISKLDELKSKEEEKDFLDSLKEGCSVSGSEGGDLCGFTLTEEELESLPEDVRKEVEDEVYVGGDLKSKQNNIDVSEGGKESVSDFAQNTDDDRAIRDTCPGISSTTEEVKDFGVIDQKKEMSVFLTKIVGKPMREFYLDGLRHYNRRSRGDTNILYTSVRRKNPKRTQKKLGILIDVSGSMNTDAIGCAISTLKKEMNNLNSESVVVSWNTCLQEESYLREFSGFHRSGGGTDLVKGIRYLVEEKKVDTIVIYSDFCDSIEGYNRYLKSIGKSIDIYPIAVVKRKSPNSVCGSTNKAKVVSYFEKNLDTAMVRFLSTYCRDALLISV